VHEKVASALPFLRLRGDLLHDSARRWKSISTSRTATPACRPNRCGRGTSCERTPAGAFTLAALHQVLSAAPRLPRRRARPGAHRHRLHEYLQQVRKTQSVGADFAMTILVTGGAGFIGSNFVLDWFAQGTEPVVNLDKLTYAANPETSNRSRTAPRTCLSTGHLQPGAGAASSPTARTARPRPLRRGKHVDRSIHGPGEFVQTISSARSACSMKFDSGGKGKRLPSATISGSCTSRRTKCSALSRRTNPPFTESTPFAPNSPYAASKAAADHLVRSYHHTVRTADADRELLEQLRALSVFPRSSSR